MIGKLKKLLFILLLFNLISVSQELEVIARPNPAIFGEQIILEFKINKKGENFSPPKFEQLQILSGPNPSTQSSYSIINGKTESRISTSYTYILRSASTGTINIPPASVIVDGKKVSSNVYSIEVKKASERTESERKALSENLFIEVTIDKKNIFVGEQTLVEYKLYTRFDIANPTINTVPSLNGFWVKDLKTSSRYKEEIKNGIRYNSVSLKKSVITPQKSGVLFIDPLELECSTIKQNQRQNIFDIFSGPAYKQEIIKSNSLKLNVKEIANPPKNYSGIVGDFSISSTISKNKIHANEALTYKVEIKGVGNFELINPLDINFPIDFDVYDPKISKTIFEGGRKPSKKIFEYILIPRFKGEYKIPAAELIVFNNKVKKFEKLQTNSHKLNILKSKNKEQENVNINEIKVESIEEDIDYILNKTSLMSSNKNTPLSQRNFIALFIFPLFFMIAFNIIKKIFLLRKNNRDNKTNKIALKKLKNAQKSLEQNNYERFYEEIEKVLWGYFAHKFKVSIANLSKETISNYFIRYSILEETKEKFINLIDDCEIARYTPSENKKNKMEKILIDAKQIIINVEKELK